MGVGVTKKAWLILGTAALILQSLPYLDWIEINMKIYKIIKLWGPTNIVRIILLDLEIK